jgi:hypothetical protein
MMTRDDDEVYELLNRPSSETEEYDRNTRSVAAWESSSTLLQRVFRKLLPLYGSIFRKRRSHIVTPKDLRRTILTFGFALRAFVFISGFLIVISVIRAIIFPSYQHPPAHYQVLSDAVSGSILPGRGNPNKEKIFIAANILQEDLIRGPWGDSVLELIELLGPDNVFLSIYENDSGSGTVNALKELRSKVTCKSEFETRSPPSILQLRWCVGKTDLLQATPL